MHIDFVYLNTEEFIFKKLFVVLFFSWLLNIIIQKKTRHISINLVWNKMRSKRKPNSLTEVALRDFQSIIQ